MRPPMMLTPSGRRSSEPVPAPRARGRAPSIAAIVVIRMGRRRPPLAPLEIERNVDDHDRVLLDDADQQDDPDDRDDRQVHPADHQGQQRAHSRRGQGGEDGQRVHVALVEHAEHDVDGEQRRQDQHRLVGQRLLEHLGGALETAVHVDGHGDVRLGLLDGVAHALSVWAEGWRGPMVRIRPCPTS